MGAIGREFELELSDRGAGAGADEVLLGDEEKGAGELGSGFSLTIICSPDFKPRLERGSSGMRVIERGGYPDLTGAESE